MEDPWFDARASRRIFKSQQQRCLNGRYGPIFFLLRSLPFFVGCTFGARRSRHGPILSRLSSAVFTPFPGHGCPGHDRLALPSCLWPGATGTDFAHTPSTSIDFPCSVSIAVEGALFFTLAAAAGDRCRQSLCRAMRASMQTDLASPLYIFLSVSLVPGSPRGKRPGLQQRLIGLARSAGPPAAGVDRPIQDTGGRPVVANVKDEPGAAEGGRWGRPGPARHADPPKVGSSRPPPSTGVTPASHKRRAHGQRGGARADPIEAASQAGPGQAAAMTMTARVDRP
jgi:hypothetical protein